MTEVKLGESFYPGIDTEFDKLGGAAAFDIEVVNAATGAKVIDKNDTGAELGDDGVTPLDVVTASAFSELEWSLPDVLRAGTTDKVAKEGVSKFTVLTGNTFVAGDRFKTAAGELYYVEDATDTSITIRGELSADIPDAEVLTQVGNTGIYKTPIKLQHTGEYFITVSHPEFGHVSSKYKVTNENLDGAVTKMEEGFDALAGKGRMIPVN